MWKLYMCSSDDSQMCGTFTAFWELCTCTHLNIEYVNQVFNGKAYVSPNVDERRCDLPSQNGATPVIQLISLQKSNYYLKNNFEWFRVPHLNIQCPEAFFTFFCKLLCG